MINSWEEAMKTLALNGGAHLVLAGGYIDPEEADRRFDLYEEAIAYVFERLEFPEGEEEFVRDWLREGDWNWPKNRTLSNLQAELNERFEEIAELDNPAAAEEGQL